MSPSKGPQTLDISALEQKALSYLERFDATAVQLRRVLRRFVASRLGAGAESAPGLSRADWDTRVDVLIERYRGSGLIDDRRYAEALGRGLRARGASRAAVLQRLRGRGVDGETAALALQSVDVDGGASAEFTSACALVRRRRLGNYRPSEERRDKWQRDLAVIARAGFDFDTARRALTQAGSEDEET